MPMYQRRRPSPIKIFMRQQAPNSTETGEESPESPDSPFSSPSSAGGLSSPESELEEEAEGVEGVEGEESEDEEEEGEEPEVSGAPSGAAPPAPSGISATASGEVPSGVPATAPPGQAPSVGPTTGVSSGATAAPQITDGPSSTDIGATLITSLLPGTGLELSSSGSVDAISSTTGVSRSAQSEVAGNAGNAEGSSIGQDQPPRPSQNSNGGNNGMSKAAEAALITFTILGGLALIIGALLFIKKRRRAKQQNNLRHAEDAFDPGNTGSLRQPETVHTGHLTRSTDQTISLFGGGSYQRPETVSTENNRSRIAPPEPTPNPFADPPLNKAFDVLRGRPRSTTLTDRGSWVKNPFQDPVSERFDPFGELQEKARVERVRYMEELRLEQELLERERDGMRNGSDVTVGGLGVLDRGEKGYLR